MPVELSDLAFEDVAVEGVGVDGVRTTRSGDGAERVSWLVDNAEAYGDLLREIARAECSIRITQLAFDADCTAYMADGSSTRLLDALVDAHRARGVRVEILLNASLLLDTATPLRSALHAVGASTIEVRGVREFPQLLHAKVFIVDERVAFLVGAPFVNGYWDDSTHEPVDARRPLRELGGRPLHDLTVRLDGAPAADLAALFDSWWTEVGECEDGQRQSMLEAASTDTVHAPGGDRRIRVARTSPRGVFANRRRGYTEILRAMLDGIGRAERLIYVEHQYLSSRRIIRALAAALVRAPELEIIAVLNQNPDVTAYRGWQNARLRESGLLTHPRVGLFALWCRGASDGAPLAVNQVFLHSKVIAVDDMWATAGSANVDGVSLHSYGSDFESRLGERVFRHVRNFDVNVVISGSDEATADRITALRTRLWQEHLGGSAADRYDVSTRGWLDFWRRRARANADFLCTAPDARGAHDAGSFVLPYSLESHPRRQLEDICSGSVAHLDLRFSPSWLEVHCSPNWIRNMFA